MVSILLETTIGTLSSKKIPFFFQFSLLFMIAEKYILINMYVYLVYQLNQINLKIKNDLRVNWKAGVIFEP